MKTSNLLHVDESKTGLRRIRETTMLLYSFISKGTANYHCYNGLSMHLCHFILYNFMKISKHSTLYPTSVCRCASLERCLGSLLCILLVS